MNGLVLAGAALAALGWLLTNVAVLLYAERKIIGHMQLRLGPMRTGWHGLMQSPADILKLLTKEDVVPTKADKWVFALAPTIVCAATYVGFVTIPWGPGIVPRDLSIGLFFVLAFASLTPIGIVLGGWASNNKYSLLGGLRAAAQQLSYEVPLLLSVIGVVMIAGTMSLTEIVAAQKGLWFVVVQPVGFVLFLIGAVAEMNRIPFDMPEAESELVAGFATEYSGMRWALFFVAEYGVMLVMSALAAILFLGGWNLFGLAVPGWIVMLAKTYAVCFLVMWLRATWPRVRVDQLMDLGWKVLLPVALGNILVTGIGIFALKGGT
jgi:NADH-quinone oxidoreductase subunit H